MAIFDPLRSHQGPESKRLSSDWFGRVVDLAKTLDKAPQVSKRLRSPSRNQWVWIFEKLKIKKIVRSKYLMWDLEMTRPDPPVDHSVIS